MHSLWATRSSASVTVVSGLEGALGQSSCITRACICSCLHGPSCPARPRSVAVYLFPEDDAHPPYLGRIRSAFVDESAVGVDPPPHNIEVGAPAATAMLQRERGATACMLPCCTQQAVAWTARHDLSLHPGLQVKWFERRVNLETSTKGIIESEKEVFELEDTGACSARV